jgi:hypothetical protein
MSRPALRASAPPYLPLDIKRPTERGHGAFAFEVFWALAFGFCFGLFGVESFWKGKELLKIKELLKGNC